MQAYRRDIDGLRAVAVVVVVFCHAHVPGFNGGFLGVDVFFVISGFLITNILVREDGTLGQTILNFYERRVRRIAPALIAVLAACTIAALALLSPFELKAFATSLLASVTFVSNFYFMRGADYFAPNTEIPLLHLWSLGVEEQFYIFYPLALWAMMRHARRFLLPAIIVVFVLSLGLSEWLVHGQTRYAFYFTGSRAWELMLGAIAALYSLRSKLPSAIIEPIAAAGVIALAVPVVFFDEKTPWPGIDALLPCTGTALLLHLHENHRTAVSRLLSAKPLVGIGLISYSLYLWHWPLFEFFQRWALRTPTPFEYAMMIGVALVAAAVSWRFIEQPFRRVQGGLSRKFVYATAAACAGALLFAYTAIDVANGFPKRFPPAAVQMYAYLGVAENADFRQQTNHNNCYVSPPASYPLAGCFMSVRGRTNVLLWGDSTARSYITGLREQAWASNINIIQANYQSCRPVLVAHQMPSRCEAFNREIFAHLDPSISAVVMSGLFFNRRDLIAPFVDTVSQVARKGIPVVVLGPTPEFDESLPLYLERYLVTGDAGVLAMAQSRIADVAALDAKMRELFVNKPSVTYVSVVGTMCPKNRCPLFIGDAPAQFDRHHLTLQGSHAYSKALWPQIQRGIINISRLPQVR